MCYSAKTIKTFTGQLDDTEGRLREALERVTEGLPPSKEEIKRLSSSMKDLRKSYVELKELAAKDDEDEYDEGTSGFVLIKAIEEKERLHSLQERYDSLIDILATFETIYSREERYDDAVDPHRKAAAQALERLRSLEGHEVPVEIEEDGRVKKAFIDAVNSDELGDETGEELLDTVGSAYNDWRLQQGLMMHKYEFCSTPKDEAVDGVPQVDDESESQASLQNEIEEDGVSNQLPGDERPVSDSVDESAQLEAGEQPDECEAVGSGELTIEEESSTDDVDEETSVFDDEDAMLSRSECGKIVDKINASSLKKELMRHSGKSFRVIIPVLSLLGCVGRQDMEDIAEILDPAHTRNADIDGSANYLARRGIVSIYHDSDGPIYCLTSAGRMVIEKRTIRELKVNRESYWARPISVGGASYDEGLPLSSVERSRDLAGQYMCCLSMINDPSSRDTVGKIRSIDYDGLHLTIRAVKDGVVREVVALTEGEDLPDGYDQAVYLSPFEKGLDENCDIEAGYDVALAESTREGHASSDVYVGQETTPVEAPDSNQIADEPADHRNVSADGSPDEAELDETASKHGDGADEVSMKMGVVAERAVQDQFVEDRADEIEEANDKQIAPAQLIGDQQDLEPSDNESIPSGIEVLLGEAGIENVDVPTDDQFVKLAEYMLVNPEEGSADECGFEAVGCSLALLEAAVALEGYPASQGMFEKLSLATGILSKGLDYSGDALASAFGTAGNLDEQLMLAASCRALFDPKNPYDYELWHTCEPFLEQYDKLFPNYGSLRALFAKLLEIHEVSPERGFNEGVLDKLGDRATRSKKLNKMRETATGLLEKPKFKTKIHGMPQFSDASFGKKSDLYACMAIIKDDKRDEVSLVREVLSQYCSGPEGKQQIDDSAIDRAIDTSWRAAVVNMNTKGIRRLDLFARKQAIESFQSRLSLIEKWLKYVDSSGDDETVAGLGRIRKELMAILDEALSSADEDRSDGDQYSVVVKHMLMSLRARLVDGVDEPPLFYGFLRTGRLSLDDDEVPIIEGAQNAIRFFEPWRCVLRHWVDGKPSFEDAVDAINSINSETFDNLRQLSHLERMLGRRNGEANRNDILKRVTASADHDEVTFHEELEIAYAVGRIDESQRELLQAYMIASKDSLYAAQDFGRWRQLISALRRQVDCLSEGQGSHLAERLESCENALSESEECELLEQARRLLFEEKNFAVVEEYLNRFEAGKRTLPESYAETDSFGEFISDDVYTPLFNACQRGKGQQFSQFARRYVKRANPDGWTNRQNASAEKLISNWPSSGKKPDPNAIAALFRSFGMRVKSAKVNGVGRERYLLEIRPERGDRPEYDHPIAIFGTRPRTPLDVIVLHGNHSEREILNQVSAARVNGMSIVILNSYMSLQTRRKVAEAYQTSRSKISPFLVIDQILALHLALHEETERLPILLKCTLPFTSYQPFVRDGGATADEMFSGRESELRQIIDPQGATVVYGGRQLGKTALLERAESLQNTPDKGRIAVYVNILQCSSEKEFVDKVLKTINDKTELQFEDPSTIAELCDSIRSVMVGKRGDKKINSMLLLIDEADRFLESISEEQYMPLTPLVELKRETRSDFKFVLAGLHNVVRYKNATANNGIFGQLGVPLCVKPLKPADALRLMSRPLNFLGFQVDRYPHIETILTNTNYYPGILQFFGYELVDTMNKQYGQYYQAANGNPPYSLSKEQLGDIMASRGLNDSIKEKFLMSLRLDPRYLALARCVALLTYDNEGDGFSEVNGLQAERILALGNSWDISALKNETLSSTVILLDEMVDMGILAKGVGEKDGYRLRMHRFLSIIGSADSIYEAIVAEEVEDE